MTRYGSEKSVPLHKFEVLVYRDGEPEWHAFQAAPRLHAGDLQRLVGLMADEKVQNSPIAAMHFVDMIGRSMVNKDGVSVRWQPEVLPKPDDVDEKDWEPKFRSPDGEILPVSEVDKFLAFEAGSSKRRWHHLMSVDPDVVIEMDTLQAMLKDLFGVLIGRPTTAPQQS